MSLDSLSNSTLLKSSLLLLGIDTLRYEKEVRTPLDDAVFSKNNSKAFYYILHFLLSNLVNESQQKKFLTCFPVKTLQDAIEFKEVALEILREMENEQRIPKNFVLSKSLLDVHHGEKLVSFLRFLSEITMLTQVRQHFPKESPEIFVLNPKNSTLDNKHGSLSKEGFDMNDYFLVSSYHDDNYILSKVSVRSLERSTKACRVHIEIQSQNLHKQIKKFQKDAKAYRESATQVYKQFLEIKEESVSLIQSYKGFRENVPKELFSESRALDRMPLLDYLRETEKRVADIKEIADNNEFESKWQEYELDSRKDNLLNRLDVGTILVDRDSRKFLNGRKLDIKEELARWSSGIMKAQKLSSARGKVDLTKMQEKLQLMKIKSQENIKILQRKISECKNSSGTAV